MLPGRLRARLAPLANDVDNPPNVIAVWPEALPQMESSGPTLVLQGPRAVFSSMGNPNIWRLFPDLTSGQRSLRWTLTIGLRIITPSRKGRSLDSEAPFGVLRKRGLAKCAGDIEPRRKLSLGVLSVIRINAESRFEFQKEGVMGDTTNSCSICAKSGQISGLDVFAGL